VVLCVLWWFFSLSATSCAFLGMVWFVWWVVDFFFCHVFCPLRVIGGLAARRSSFAAQMKVFFEIMRDRKIRSAKISDYEY
jgi:hypothetical protein